MITYRGFFENGLIKIVTLLIFSSALAAFIFYSTVSYLAAVLGFLTPIIVRRIFWGGRLRKKRRQINTVFESSLERSNKQPLLEAKAWVKGVCEIDRQIQPLWVNVDSKKIYLYFLCQSRKPPFFVDREDVKITISNESQAKLIIKRMNLQLVIPWSQKFWEK